MGIAAVGLSFFPSLYTIYDFANRIFNTYQNTAAWIAQWERFFIEGISFRTLDSALLSLAIVGLFIFLTSPTHRNVLLLGILSILFHLGLLMRWNHPPKVLICHVYKNSLLLTTKQQIGIAHFEKKTKKIIQLAAQFKLDNSLDSIQY